MAFATTADVAARMGRDLTITETSAAAALLDAATAAIAAAVDKDTTWADTLSPVPRIVSVLCVELATRAMANPQGIASLQETLGAYSSTVRFRDYDGAGVMLTPAEERLVRRALGRRGTGSVVLRSILDDLYAISDEEAIS